jgi:retron-type reverse transcriptase
MERTEIRTTALAMKNIKDLRRMLNQVKQDALGDKFRPFHLNQITYHCNPKRATHQRYKNFTIPKKSGGERVISAPVAGLKSILFSLNTILQAIYEPSKYAMGFVQGRSVVDNAKLHLGQNYIYNLDLKDFFPSIDKSRLWKRLTLPPFNFPSELSDVIAGLCTMRLEEDGKETRYVLPQGAPTSPTITNIICEKLDRQLGGLAKRFGAKYSRYADDITFSSMNYIYSNEGEFIKELHRIIADNHFTINEKKTRLQKVGERQEVTGLILSDKVNVVRTYTREVRTLLHIWEKFGHMAACESYMRARTLNPTHRHKGGMPSLDAVLMGKLQYLKMVKGAEDATYKALNSRFAKLQGQELAPIKYAQKPLAYVHTMNREEFEETLSSQIEYNPETTPALYFKVGDDIRPITVSQTVPVKELFAEGDEAAELWRKYQISLCDNGISLFYMLHKKLVAPQHTKAGKQKTDELQEELSALVESDIFSQVLNEDKVRGKNYKVVSMEDIASGRVEIANRERLIALMEADIPEPDNF